MNLKAYLFSLRHYILFSSLVFIFAIFNGYFIARNLPVQTKEILETFKEFLEPITEMNPFKQLLIVFLNNALTTFSALLFGTILGIFPFLCLLVNGGILGALTFLSCQSLSLSVFLMGILPHGIIEIPVLVVCCSSGMKIGKEVGTRLFTKRGKIKEEFLLSFTFFLRVLLPLLFLAAVIEVFITPYIINLTR